jgi:HPt (histidine-containing phosphotransfer) domain-containing protein
MNQEDTIQVLDREQLLSRYKGYESVLKQSIDIFFEETPSEMERLVSSIRESNAETAGKSAHSLLNKVGTLMGIRIMKLARRLEDHLRAGELDQARALLPVAETELELFSNELKAFRQEL